MDQDIQRACRVGDLALIQRAVKTSPLSVNQVDSKLGWTPLYRTVICGHFEAARYLLANGADANLANQQQETPLHQAAEHNQTAIAAALLTAGANPNVQTQDGETPLHKAVYKGYLKTSELLLHNGADPNLCNIEFGRTPMHYAVEHADHALVELLVKHGASCVIQDKRGKRPVDLAVSKDIQRALQSPRTAQEQPVAISPFGEITSISMSSYEKVNLSYESHLTPKDSTQHSDNCYSPTAYGLVQTAIEKPSSRESRRVPSNYKRIEDKIKEIEEMHARIASTVKQSYDAISHKSLVSEPDAERSGGFNRTAKFGDSDKHTALRKWLRDLRLDSIADRLVDAGYDDIGQLLIQMQSTLPITLEMLEEIGVKPIGSRMRFLAFLSEEQRSAQPKPSKKNPFSYCVSPSQLGTSASLPTLRSWLDNLGLVHLDSVFTRAGFDELDHLLILMNTDFPITEALLKEIGVSKPGHRIRILAKLREDSTGVTYSKSLDLGDTPRIERSGVKSACELCLVM
jgi:hypothetical protein